GLLLRDAGLPARVDQGPDRRRRQLRRRLHGLPGARRRRRRADASPRDRARQRRRLVRLRGVLGRTPDHARRRRDRSALRRVSSHHPFRGRKGVDMAATALAKHDVKDLGLSGRGKLRIEWAEAEMPVLRQIRHRFEREKPLKGVRVAACLHVTTETANLLATLRAGGAEVWVCASNPLSTQDDVAAALVTEHAMAVFSIKGEDEGTYYQHIHAVLEAAPQVTMDDGADLVSVLHKGEAGRLGDVIGGTEETTTGVIRLRWMQKSRGLKYPIVAVNKTSAKAFFRN